MQILSNALKVQNVPVLFPKFPAPATVPSSRCAPSFTPLRGAIILWIPATQSGPLPLSPSASTSRSPPSLFPQRSLFFLLPVSSFLSSPHYPPPSFLFFFFFLVGGASTVVPFSVRYYIQEPHEYSWQNPLCTLHPPKPPPPPPPSPPRPHPQLGPAVEGNTW